MHATRVAVRPQPDPHLAQSSSMELRRTPWLCDRSHDNPMPLRTPDLTNILVADLPRGRVESADSTRLLALPAAWISDLISRAPDVAVELAPRLAQDLARDAQSHLGGLTEPSPEDSAHALSLAFAARGLGLCHFERYGDALTLIWTAPPSTSAGFARFAAALSARALSILTELDVHGAVLSAGADEVRVFLGSRGACEFAAELAAAGSAPGTVFDRLTHGASA